MIFDQGLYFVIKAEQKYSIEGLTCDQALIIINDHMDTIFKGRFLWRRIQKERILPLALTKFSENGYAGTNIRELTESLGLVKSSMDKHFAGKEEIWNALLDEMERIEAFSRHFIRIYGKEQPCLI